MRSLYRFPETPWPILVPCIILAAWIIGTMFWKPKGKVVDLTKHPRAYKTNQGENAGNKK